MPFEGFLAYLRRQGFIIGVDHHLRLQELLNRLGPGCQPADLKYLICPLFATNQKQQKQFYRAFDSYFNCLEVKADIIKAKKTVTKDVHKKKDIESTEESVITRKWPYILVAAVLLLIVVLMSYWVYQPKTIDKSSKTKIEGSSGTPSDHPEEIPDAGKASKPVTESKPPTSFSESGEGKQDSTIGRKIDTSQPGQSEVREVPKIKPETSKESSEPSFDFDLVRKLVEQIDRLNNENKCKYEPTFFQRYWYMFRWVGALGVLIILLIIEIYKFNQRRLILQKQRGKKPPFIWPIRVENPELGLVKNDQFYQPARFLRRRIKSDLIQVDIPKTISNTIETAGFPSLKYKTLTRPPEYLILIDLPAYRDHHTHLFDSIAKALEKEGLFVARYFYEKDPRVCFKEPDGQRFYLSDLKTRYSNHRLIIFGNGEEFLDPISGVLDNWTNLFQDWRERAILTPEPPKYWSAREVALAHEFIVLPASLEGLAALADHFKLSLEPDLKTWKKADSQNIGIPAPECNIDELKAYLGEDAFQWLCACAVYPELHWDLTLYLGSLPCMPENLINEENLLRLIRLPWFRTGSMPDELRWALINELDSRKSRVIRTSIIELLKKNPPPKESFAFETYRLQLVVQRWMLSRKNRKQRKEMIDKLKTVSEKEIVQDYILLRFLDSTSRSPLSFVLPKRLKKVFCKKGVPLFGFRTGISILLAFLIAASFFIFLREPQIHDIEKILKFPELVPLKGGIFQMGSAPTDKNSSTSEHPQHEVKITPFAIGKFEVTNEEFVQFLNERGNQEEGGGLWLLIDPFLTKIKFTFFGKFVVEKGYENYPVVGVSWNGANAYCRWLKERTGIPFRLPTEAEWEYACRGGTKTGYSFGEDTINHEKYGWFRSNSGFRPHEVGQKLPNKFGLYDIHGNMWEWCLDGWSKNYENASKDGSAVLPIVNNLRVVRGGSIKSPVEDARSSNRHRFAPGVESSQMVGFRVAASLKKGYHEDVILFRRNNQKGFMVVLGSYKDVAEAVENVNKLRTTTQQDIKLYYAVNDYYAPIIGIFESKELARQKLREMLKFVPDAYDYTSLAFPYEIKIKQRVEVPTKQNEEDIAPPESFRGKMPDEVKKVALKGIKVEKNEKGYWEVDFGDGIIMVYIPFGEFTMGQTDVEKRWLIEIVGEKDYYLHYKDEKPLHKVYMDGYWMGKYEVTVNQFDLFDQDTGYVTQAESNGGTYTWTGKNWEQKAGINWKNPGYNQENNHPVVCISWNDALEYCKWLSNKTGFKFKLPTEAQWEKAARGTDVRKYPWGNHPPFYKGLWYANYSANDNWDKRGEDGFKYTAPVGSYIQGASFYGLLDMAGNAWEWCDDWYGGYSSATQENPIGPKSGFYRVLRGGSWYYNARNLRCAFRNYIGPSNRYTGSSFRLCMENELVDPSERDYRGEDKFKSPENDPIVYITRTGKKYHRADCSYLRYDKIKIRLSEAKRKGYTHCQKCKPQE